MLATVSLAEAQTTDGSAARMRFGPFRLTPSVSVHDVGIDSNVFNDPVNPKADFTATTSPRLDAWLRAGRTRIWFAPSADLIQFKTFSNQSSFDRRINTKVERVWNRLVPWVAGGAELGRQRTNHEFDTRVRRTSTEVSLGADVRLSAKVKIGVSGNRQVRRHDRDALAFGNNLSLLLDRTTTTYGTSASYAVTPLTTIALEASTSGDRFPFSPDRNADSVRAGAGFEFDTRALVSGRFKIGYRQFKGIGASISDFRGLTSMASLRTVVKTRTRVDLALARDLDYSFELSYPYYVLTSVSLGVIPRLTQRWDVEGRLGLDRLNYQGLPGLTLPDRRVRFTRAGGGVGYHLGRDIRVAFNIDRDRREAPIEGRTYSAYRAGTAVSFGR